MRLSAPKAKRPIAQAALLVTPAVFVFVVSMLALLFVERPAAAQAGAVPKTRIACYTAYDNDFFYFAAVIQKPSLVGTHNGFPSTPLLDDSVAIFLQREPNPALTARTANSSQMAVSVAGGVQLYRGANAFPLTGFQDFLKSPEGSPQPFKYGVSHKGALNGPTSISNSYTVEMAIPWAEVGGPPTVGQRMRFNVAAFSAAPTSAPFLSLSPTVTKPAEMQNPALWTEIVFVDAPVKSVANAPQARVSARLYSAKPIIDGELDEALWSSITSFGFAESGTGAAVELTPAAGISRAKPKVTLTKARPAILPAARKVAPMQPRVPQTVPRLVFALYNYDFQNDPRKSAPLRSVRASTGATLIPSHPMEGDGPWMTFDRVDWHRKQIDDVRRAGIDVLLPVYRGGVPHKQSYSQRGLLSLTAALREAANRGADYPLLGLYLDTSALGSEGSPKLDLLQASGRQTLYAAIKDFYLAIPTRFRLSVALDAKNGGGSANVVVLSNAAALDGVDAAFIDYCRERFRADFGADLLFLGGSDFKGKAPLDGYVNDTHGRGFQMEEGGWIKAASLGVGYDETLKSSAAGSLRPRDEGEAYRKDWKQAVARKPDWVFIDGWNDFAQGAEIAPSLQHGIEYVDITRTFSRAFAGGGAVLMRAEYVGHNIPTAALAGSTFKISTRILNAGTSVWTPDSYMATYNWTGANGSAVGPTVSVPLPSQVLPGQAATLSFDVKVPSAPGAYRLNVDVAQISKKGEVMALFSGLGSRKLEEPVRVAAAGDAGLPDYALSLIANDLPVTLEAGGTYFAHVTVRNDGAKSWKKGEGGRLQARVWRYISPLNGTGERETMEPVEMADAGADLPADVLPGQVITVTVPVTFSDVGGIPVRAVSQADNWSYQLRWEYSADSAGTAGAVAEAEPLALVEADFGPQFTLDLTPPQLPGERRVPVKLGVRNLGPQTWLKDVTRIGYHWYYLDGTEAVWQDETTPITQDIESGGEVSEMLVWVTAPPHGGTYFLVWDMKIGDTWTSTLPSIRGRETLVKQIDVVHGRSTPIDLGKGYNLDGVASSNSRSDGDFDGAGHTFPSELVPPFALTDQAPSTIWQPSAGVGLDSSRRISFKWGPKTEKDKNFVQCLGQKLPLVEPKKAEVTKAVHLLAATTKGDVLTDFTVIFDDGSQQFTSFPLSRWDAPPTHGEEVAFFSRYTRSRTGDLLDKPAALFHYTIRISESKKKVVAILLPNKPEVRIAAITLEK